MCGIVGVAGDLSHAGRKAFKMMLMLDTIRGPHSTGVVTVKGTEVHIDKYLGTPWEFFKKATERFTKGTPDHGAQILIGHNRYATLGGITEDNAHPFNHGNVYGVHNGTLTYTGQKNVDPDNKFDTDSEALYYQMNEVGLVETYKKLIGAWALVWYNKEQKRVNFIRNKERPLYYAISEDGKMLFWASEDWMIDHACYTHGIKLREILEFKEDIHYKTRWSAKKGVGLIEGKEPLEKGKPPVYKYSTNHSGGTSNNGGFFGTKGKTDASGGENPMGKIRDAYEKYSGKWVRFYMTPSTDTEVSYGANSLTSWDDDIYDIVIPHTRSRATNAKDVETFFQHDWNNWFYGLVRFVSASDGELRLVVDIDSVSEPLGWKEFKHTTPATLSLREYNEKNISSMSKYLEVMGVEEAIENGVLKTYLSEDEEEVDDECGDTGIKFGDEVIERDQVASILDQGCGWCGQVEEMENLPSALLLRDYSYLCSNCASCEQTREYCGASVH